MELNNNVVKTIKGRIHLSSKMWDVIQDTSRYIHLEGVTGSGKTIAAGLWFIKQIHNSPKEHRQFVLVGSSTPTLEKAFIDNPLSFYNTYKYQRTRNGRTVQVMTYKKQGQGGSRIEYQTKNGKKIIYLAGFDNKARYKAILGLTLYGMMLDEVHTAHDEFIREAYTRLARDGGFKISTSNAGLPDQILYKDYENKGRPSEKWAHDVPPETWKELLETPADPRFRFYWFGFTDSPVMSDDQIAELYSIHPVGSFEYNSKIIAIRGYVEGLLYARLINDNYVTKDYSRGTTVRWGNINHYAFQTIAFGIDIGSNTGDDASTSKTVFILEGMSRDGQRLITLDAAEAKGDFDYNDMVQQFNEFMLPYYSLYQQKIIGVFVESADPLFIRTLRNNIIKNIPVAPSIKYPIKERVTIKQQLLNQGRWYFSDKPGAQKAKRMLTKIKTDGKGGHMDDGTEEIDYSDGMDYGMAPMVPILKNFRLQRIPRNTA